VTPGDESEQMDIMNQRFDTFFDRSNDKDYTNWDYFDRDLYEYIVNHND